MKYLTNEELYTFNKLKDFITKDQRMLDFFTTRAAGKTFLLNALEDWFKGYPFQNKFNPIMNPFIDGESK